MTESSLGAARDPRIRVLLVDDQAMVRGGLPMILESEDDIDVVGEAADGATAIDAVRRLRPDVVLMDIQMAGMDGLEATRRIVAAGVASRRPDGPAAADDGPHVVILTTFEIDEYVFRAIRSGASGFLLKNAPPDDLVAAVRAVADGGALLAPTVTRRLIEAFVAAAPAPSADRGRLGSLTEREREVLLLVARGLSNAEIAERLVVGEATVKTHVSNVLAKLDLRDRVQAVVFAYESGLVGRARG
ncbi:MAG: response regulator transcription factor [Chloroflexi bacterium]|nr:MAG: response regulator transcription factor [Chloroflexota bacterium]